MPGQHDHDRGRRVHWPGEGRSSGGCKVGRGFAGRRGTWEPGSRTVGCRRMFAGWTNLPVLAVCEKRSLYIFLNKWYLSLPVQVAQFHHILCDRDCVIGLALFINKKSSKINLMNLCPVHWARVTYVSTRVRAPKLDLSKIRAFQVAPKLVRCFYLLDFNLGTHHHVRLLLRFYLQSLGAWPSTIFFFVFSHVFLNNHDTKNIFIDLHPGALALQPR